MKIILPFILITVFLIGCQSQEYNAKLRFGTNDWAGYEPIYLANSRFPSLGELITLVEYSTSSEVMSDFKKGKLDVAFITLDEALQLSTDIEDLIVFKIINFSNGADVVLGQGEVTSLSMLKNKRVGVEETTVGMYMLSRALSFVDMTLSDIERVSVPINKHIEKFSRKEIDAIVTFEPFGSKLRASGATLLFDSSQIPYEIIDLMVTRKSILSKNQTSISEVLKIWNKTIQLFKTEKNSSLIFMNQRLKLDKVDLYKVYDGLQFADTKSEDKVIKILESTSETLIEKLKKMKKVPDDYKLPEGFFQLM